MSLQQSRSTHLWIMVSVVLCFWKFLEQDQKHELSTVWSRYSLRKAGLWVNVYPCNARDPSNTFSMPKPQRAWISMLSREYLDYFSMPNPTRAIDVFLVQDSTHSWIMIEADISFENLDYELMFILMFIHTTSEITRLLHRRQNRQEHGGWVKFWE